MPNLPFLSKGKTSMHNMQIHALTCKCACLCASKHTVLWYICTPQSLCPHALCAPQEAANAAEERSREEARRSVEALWRMAAKMTSSFAQTQTHTHTHTHTFTRAILPVIDIVFYSSFLLSEV